MMNVFCPECGSKGTLTPENWCCQCRGAWEFEEVVSFDPSMIITEEASIWRYKHQYGLDFENPSVRLGAGWTPLLAAVFEDRQVLLKPEYFSPSGSFKDRGTEIMINILADQGVTRVVEDSSGNAGASVAAYAARAGMQANIFVPAHASPIKLAQITIYGATVHPIPGPRLNAKLAAMKAIKNGLVFASHSYHPGFLLGQESVAWEVWEQLGHKAPDWYVVPVGQGVHMLGVWLGFKRLKAAGLVDKIPRLAGVQASLLAPLQRAYQAGMDTIPAIVPTVTSIAEGLAIAEPVRGRRLLQAVRESNGICLTVEEEQIRSAQHSLAMRGFYVEPTSATVIAALQDVIRLASPGETIVIPLTGSGLKGAPILATSV